MRTPPKLPITSQPRCRCAACSARPWAAAGWRRACTRRACDRARHLEPPRFQIDLGIVSQIGVEREALERRDLIDRRTSARDETSEGKRRRAIAQRQAVPKDRIARPVSVTSRTRPQQAAPSSGSSRAAVRSADCCARLSHGFLLRAPRRDQMCQIRTRRACVERTDAAGQRSPLSPRKDCHRHEVHSLSCTSCSRSRLPRSHAVAYAQQNPIVGGKEMFPNKNIIENAVNSADHTTLVAAVKAAGLVDTLQGAGPVHRVRADQRRRSRSCPPEPSTRCSSPRTSRQLTKVLTYHVVAGTALERRSQEADQGGQRHGHAQDRQRRHAVGDDEGQRHRR